MFSATSLVLRSRRSLISAAGTVSRIGTYINNPTNKAFFTPHSVVLRCFLSTIPDKDTSGSVSHLTTTKKKKKMTKMMMKVGDNPINILPKTSSVIHSADLGTRVSVKSSDSKKLKPVDRDVEMSSLKDTIKSKDADLRSLSKEIASAPKKQAQLLEKAVLSSNESRLLRVIEDVNLPDMKGREKRLVAEIAEHKAEFRQLNNPKELADAPVPAQGI